MTIEFDAQTMIALYMLVFVVWEFFHNVVRKLPDIWRTLQNKQKFRDKFVQLSIGVLIMSLMFAPVVYYGNNSLKSHTYRQVGEIALNQQTSYNWQVEA